MGSMGVNIEEEETGQQVHLSEQFADFKFPKYLTQRVGSDTIQRGRWPVGPNKGKSAAKKSEKNYALVFWDHLLYCEKVVDCPLKPCTYSQCTYKSGFKRGHKYCLLQKVYLKSIIAAGLQYIERTGNDFDKIAILGFHLLPLYNILFMHKLEMLRMQRDGGWTRDPNNLDNVHPVFAEFRKTLEDIERVWKKLGQRRKGGYKTGPPDMREGYLNRLMGGSAPAAKPKASRRTRKPNRKDASYAGTGAKF